MSKKWYFPNSDHNSDEASCLPLFSWGDKARTGIMWEEDTFEWLPESILSPMFTFHGRKCWEKGLKAYASIPYIQGVSKDVAGQTLRSRCTWNLCTPWGIFFHVLKFNFLMQINQMSCIRLAALTVMPTMLVRLAELSKLVYLSIRKEVEKADFSSLPWKNILEAITIRLTGRTSASLMLSPSTTRGWPEKWSTYAANLSHSTGIRAVCQTSTNWPHNDPHPILCLSAHSELVMTFLAGYRSNKYEFS